MDMWLVFPRHLGKRLQGVNRRALIRLKYSTGSGLAKFILPVQLRFKLNTLYKFGSVLVRVHQRRII